MMGDYEKFYISVAGKDITNDEPVTIHDIKIYNVGDEYPRKDLGVLPSRIKELASDKNRRGCPLIEEIPEVEEKPEKKTKPTKKVGKE